jgi:hypothetical protein
VPPDPRWRHPRLAVEDASADTIVIIDPAGRPGAGIDCACTWTPAPGTTPEAAADAIIAVLDAIRPVKGRM